MRYKTNNGNQINRSNERNHVDSSGFSKKRTKTIWNAIKFTYCKQSMEARENCAPLQVKQQRINGQTRNKLTKRCYVCSLTDCWVQLSWQMKWMRDRDRDRQNRIRCTVATVIRSHWIDTSERNGFVSKITHQNPSVFIKCIRIFWNVSTLFQAKAQHFLSDELTIWAVIGNAKGIPHPIVSVAAS